MESIRWHFDWHFVSTGEREPIRSVWNGVIDSTEKATAAARLGEGLVEGREFLHIRIIAASPEGELRFL
jgi:hypothetical protein